MVHEIEVSADNEKCSACRKTGKGFFRQLPKVLNNYICVECLTKKIEK